MAESMTDLSDLTAAGDQMQGALSRLCEHLRKQQPFATAPYEVCMAILEGEASITDWTAARIAAGEALT